MGGIRLDPVTIASTPGDFDCAPASPLAIEPGMPGIVVYTYAACDSCRRAVAWLRNRGVAFTERPIRENPPMASEIRRAIEQGDGDLKRVFNTAGQDYRAFGLSSRLPTMRPADAVALLAGNGRLVKRPFLVGPGFATAGFNEKHWSSLLESRPE